MNLPCSCSRTATYMRSICPDAERLWDRVADAHNALTKAIRANRPTREPRRVQAQWAYDEALAAYEAHFVAPEPAAAYVAMAEERIAALKNQGRLL